MDMAILLHDGLLDLLTVDLPCPLKILPDTGDSATISSSFLRLIIYPVDTSNAGNAFIGFVLLTGCMGAGQLLIIMCFEPLPKIL